MRIEITASPLFFAVIGWLVFIGIMWALIALTPITLVQGLILAVLIIIVRAIWKASW